MAVKATVISTPKNRVSINNPQRAEIRTVGITPSTTLVNSLRGLSDVNATSLANNNTVVYDSASDKFVVKELPVLNGGTF
jgi:hypothetical protein